MYHYSTIEFYIRATIQLHIYETLLLNNYGTIHVDKYPTSIPLRIYSRYNYRTSILLHIYPRYNYRTSVLLHTYPRYNYRIGYTTTNSPLYIYTKYNCRTITLRNITHPLNNPTTGSTHPSNHKATRLPDYRTIHVSRGTIIYAFNYTTAQPVNQITFTNFKLACTAHWRIPEGAKYNRDREHRRTCSSSRALGVQFTRIRLIRNPANERAEIYESILVEFTIRYFLFSFFFRCTRILSSEAARRRKFTIRGRSMGTACLAKRKKKSLIGTRVRD